MLLHSVAMGVGAVVQSSLNPAGPQASSIHLNWLVMVWVAIGVFVVVMALVAGALSRGLRQDRNRPTDRALTRAVGGGVAATVVILFVLLVVSAVTGRALEPANPHNPLGIAVTGHQWWWEIEYQDALASGRVLTANEIHLPVGRPVVFTLTSRDVIHSFWVPNLNGKRDLVPGYASTAWVQADRAGVFRGQCAEFCGLQHAHMALTVIAEPPDAFDRWLDAQRQLARQPQTPQEARGRVVFMEHRCAGCHTIGGTEAQGQIAPDLTHVGSRSTIAAGTLANTTAHMREWIRDPQATKPGNQMPANALPSDDEAALAAFLAGLK